MTMNIRLEKGDDGICQVIFDRPDAVANVFDRATMHELGEHVDAIAADPDVKGVVFLSAKPTIFIAGADIKEMLSEDITPEDIREAVSFGQQVFNRIAALKVPTVAAIHGAAMGGGCEMALACDWRVASDAKATSIGCPETQLGILPAWGGSTRMPRLIGLQKAVTNILAGKRLKSMQAKKAGLVDMVCPKEHLLKGALKMIARGKAKRKEPWKQNNPLMRAIVGRVALKGVLKQTGGHYPAQPKALEVVLKGLGGSIKESLKLEEDAIVELAQTDVCKSLVGVFFLTERAKGFKYPLPEGTEPDKRPIRHVAVIGAGVMGAGIAQWASARGQQVILKDIGNEPLAKGMAGIAKDYKKAARKRVFTQTEAARGLDRIFATTRSIPLKQVDIVIEAAVENMEIKKKVFLDLAEQSRDDTILATNTSALSISELAKEIPHPERVIGIHYFNPVARMQLVEVVVGEQTSPEVVDRAVRFVQKSGKLPVVVKDSPGFIVNRILMPYLGEAGVLFEGGASVQAIDRSMKKFGMPMGPMRLIDEVGVDVCDHVAQHQHDCFGERVVVPSVMGKMLESKKLGRKSGEGFYTYPKKGKSAPNEDVALFKASDKYAGLSARELSDRMVLLMVNEAARCLEEELVAAPEDIDFAMIFGTGFAPFRGGPLRYADAAGIQGIVDALTKLSEAGEQRFEPCMYIQKMAQEGRTFYA